MKTLAAFIASLSLAACTAVPSSPTPEPPKQASSSVMSTKAASSAPAPKTLAQTYTNKNLRYEIDYPAGWTVLENARSPLTYRLKAGTALVPPDDFAKGTTFLSGQVLIETSRMPCARFVNAVQVTLNGKTFFKGDSSANGTRNYQRFMTYVTANETTRTCYSVMLYVRGCSLGTECGQDHLNSFDSKELNTTFEKMVASLRFL